MGEKTKMRDFKTLQLKIFEESETEYKLRDILES